MTIEDIIMGEQPIFSTKAHVFHIDPKTKKSWISASTAAVAVSFFYDSTRALYRIISVEGTKAVINSTITPNMTFTKTSQKFGQWSDARANTVYGLGFSSEQDLNQFIEKFQEVREATKSLQQHKSNGSSPITNVTPISSATASPVSAARSPRPIRAIGTIPAPSMDDSTTSSANVSLDRPDSGAAGGGMVNNSSNNPNCNSTNLLKASLVAHHRSQSLTGLQPAQDSPKHLTAKLSADKAGTLKMNSSSSNTPGGSTEAQLKYENERLKQALALSSANAKKWEIELSTLKSNNSRLTAALQESTTNVDEWKRQLQAYKDENLKLKTKILELEASRGSMDAASELRKEMGNWRARMESTETDVRIKDGEIQRLTQLVDELTLANTGRDQQKYDVVKSLQHENSELKRSVTILQQQLDTNLTVNDSGKRLLEALHLQMGEKIGEFAELHRELSTVLHPST